MKVAPLILVAGLALAAPGAATYGWELLHPESCLDQQPKPELEFLLPGCEAEEVSVTATFPGRHPLQTTAGGLGMCAIVAGSWLIARRRRGAAPVPDSIH